MTFDQAKVVRRVRYVVSPAMICEFIRSQSMVLLTGDGEPLEKVTIQGVPQSATLLGASVDDDGNVSIVVEDDSVDPFFVHPAEPDPVRMRIERVHIVTEQLRGQWPT